MTVFVMEHTYSKRADKQPWIVYNHYVGSVFKNIDDVLKELRESYSQAEVNHNIHDVLLDFEGRRFRYRWTDDEGVEFECFIAAFSREVK